MKVYVFEPEIRKKPLSALCISLIVLSVVLFYLAGLWTPVKAVGQLISVILILLVIQISTKYLLSQYRYVLEEGVLYLSVVTGKKIKNYGSVKITSSCRLLTLDAWEKEKNTLKAYQKLSLRQNLFSKEVRCLLVQGEEECVALFFEPDQTLTALLEEIIGKK